MELRLKDIRNQRGLSQDDMARALAIKKSRYGTWERGERMMSLEQAYNCALALGCTLNDLVGMKSESVDVLSDDEKAIVETYREVTVHGKRAMLSNTKAVRQDYQPKSDQPGAISIGA